MALQYNHRQNLDKRFSKIHLKKYKKNRTEKYTVKCFIYDHKLVSYETIKINILFSKIINIYKTIKYIIYDIYFKYII